MTVVRRSWRLKPGGRVRGGSGVDGVASGAAGSVPAKARRRARAVLKLTFSCSSIKVMLSPPLLQPKQFHSHLPSSSLKWMESDSWLSWCRTQRARWFVQPGPGGWMARP